MIKFSAQLMRKTGERFLQEMQDMIDDALEWEIMEKQALCLVRVK